MNTASTSPAARPALLVVRPVPAPDGGQGGANVVKLPPRADRAARAEDGAPSPGGGTVQVLDPVAAERTVVCAMSCKVAQAALEVLSGVRSVQQLSRWLSTMCMDSLTTRARLHAEAARLQLRRHSSDDGNVHTLYHQPQVRSVHCSAVLPGIYETSVVVADASRFRAIAMRFEQSQGLWKVTALQIG